jgi:1,4-dihydroxy-2-naphthoyl-CoA synthase
MRTSLADNAKKVFRANYRVLDSEKTVFRFSSEYGSGRIACFQQLISTGREPQKSLRVARLCLQRPEKVNALNENMLQGILAAFRKLDSVSDLRGVMISGVQDEVTTKAPFCAGIVSETTPYF